MQRGKPYLSWGILALTLAFLGQALGQHWRSVAAVSLTGYQGICLGLALGLTLLSHCWAGWVWGWILAELQYPRSPRWTLGVYLKTNVAKYLPGNIWHFYGRMAQTEEAGIPRVTSVVSVVLEPLLMAAAALVLVVGSGGPRWGALALPLLLLGVHPRCLNPLVTRLSQGKLQQWQRHLSHGIAAAAIAPTPTPSPRPVSLLQGYPWGPLGGELLFLVGRGGAFLLILAAFTPLPATQILGVLSGFSLAWLLGLVVPGAPGGLGVFEATALALFQGPLAAAGFTVDPGLVLVVIGFYRLVSTIAEVLGAGLGELLLRSRSQPDRGG